MSQVLVSRTNIYEPFQHVEVSENETVEFCIIVWGPLTEAVHVMVETTGNFALGKLASTHYKLQIILRYVPTIEQYFYIGML